LREEHTLRVVVGSRNPVKIGAVVVTLQRVFDGGRWPVWNGRDWHSYHVEGVNVPSQIADQPVSEAETIQGAVNRAKNALAANDPAEWGIGLEGGVKEIEGELFTCAWCAIVDRHGNVSYGGGLYLPLPAAMVQDIRDGIELGEATDRLFNATNSKHGGGALGYLSKDLHTRQRAYENIFIYALVKFLNPELYDLK
jgi:inosine/xanthosine triphosphatase